MTQEQKDLLLKDLCARLPYGVKGNFLNEDKTPSNDKLLRNITITYHHLITANGRGGMVMNGDIKPYLIPLSSMTEEQKKEYDKIIYRSIELHHREYSDIVEIDLFDDLQEFYHKHHLDYRGLIPMGLAIDATNLNIY